MILSALMPLAIAATFVMLAQQPDWEPSEIWIYGLVALAPLDFVRALILSLLGDAYKRNNSPQSAIKDFLSSGQRGIRVDHLLTACVDEFRENEDLPNTTNPDDWARISGKKGERIVFIRTLVQGKKGPEAGRQIDTVANTGQYL